MGGWATLRIRYDYAYTLAQLGRSGDAITELRQILRSQRGILSPNHPYIRDTQLALHRLGTTWDDSDVLVSANQGNR